MKKMSRWYIPELYTAEMSLPEASRHHWTDPQGYIASDSAFWKYLLRWGKHYYFYTGEMYLESTGTEWKEAEDVSQALTLFHDAFADWSADREDSFKRMKEALDLTYEPIENYNRYEESEDKGSQSYGADTTEHTTTESITRKDSGTVKTESTSSASALVYGFNNSAAEGQPSDSSQGSGSDTETRDLTSTDTHAGGYTDARKARSDSDTRSHTAHLHGNIGVTTSQEMLRSELSLRDPVAFTQYIMRDFLARVCSLQSEVI